MKLEIAKVVGETCITHEQGQGLYEKIHPELLAGRPVELDFAAVRIFASPFFNEAVGKLLQDLPSDRLNALLNVVHLSPVGRDVLEHVIDNSKEYYSNPDTKSALDKILSDSDKRK